MPARGKHCPMYDFFIEKLREENAWKRSKANMFRICFVQDTGTCECEDGQQVCHGLSKAVEGLLQVLPGRPTLDWIVSTHQEYIEKRWQR